MGTLGLVFWILEHVREFGAHLPAQGRSTSVDQAIQGVRRLGYLPRSQRHLEQCLQAAQTHLASEVRPRLLQYPLFSTIQRFCERGMVPQLQRQR